MRIASACFLMLLTALPACAPSFPANLCPNPTWLNVKAPTGCTHAEMQAIFQQSKGPENPERLPSAGFLSMKKCSDNPEVVFYGLMLVAQRKEYPSLQVCSAYFFNRDFGFRSLSVGDPSYHVAGAVGQVGQALIADGNPKAAVQLFERLFKERRTELPSYVAQGNGYYYAKALAQLDPRQEAITLLKDLIARYDTPEESRLTQLLAELQPSVALADPSQFDSKSLPDLPSLLRPTEAPWTERPSPHGTRIVGFSVAHETPHSIAIDLEYDFAEPEDAAGFRSACDLEGGGSEGHSGYEPGFVAAGHGKSRVNLSAGSGPDRLDSEQLRCSIYVIAGGPIAERRFPYKKRWLRRP
jgi:hypothetical protein